MEWDQTLDFEREMYWAAHPGTRHGWGYAIGAPAVVFTDWPPLRDGFLTELCARLGGRTHVVRARI